MKIFDYEEVKMNWDSFTYPIAVGTPVSVDGVLADNSSAHGLIARTVFAKPDGGDTLKIMTGGFIDMEEIVAGYGQELSSAAVQALCGIHFYKDGVCIPTGGSGGGDDSQKWKEETSTPLFSETVTTVDEGDTNEATLSYAEQITADTLKITFNGVEYTCTKRTIVDSDSVYYGAPFNFETEGFDFSEYHFNILSSPLGGNIITTETPGTYTVSVSTESVTTTDTFKQAVNDIVAMIRVDSLSEANIVRLSWPELFASAVINRFIVPTTGSPSYETSTLPSGDANIYDGSILLTYDGDEGWYSGVKAGAEYFGEIIYVTFNEDGGVPLITFCKWRTDIDGTRIQISRTDYTLGELESGKINIEYFKIVH